MSVPQWRSLALRIAINSFIAFHIAAITSLGLPIPFEPKFPFLKAIAPYLNFVGLWQNWKMFAPQPVSDDIELFAVLDWRDGHREILALPGRALAPSFAVGAEWTKWERFLNLDSFAYLRRDAALWIARRIDPGGTRLHQVTLVERIRPVPIPGQTATTIPATTRQLYVLTHR
jgi:hypothetical protein